MESSQGSSLNTNFQYSIVLVCYVGDFLGLEKSTYLDPRDQCGHLKNHLQLAIESRYIQWRFHMSTWTWNPGLWWILNYLNMVANTCTWDPDLSFPLDTHFEYSDPL
jgi:hypothetical protein